MLKPSSAVADACAQLNERLAPFKAQLPEGTFREVVNAAYFERVDLSAHGFYKTPDVTGFGGVLPFNYFTFGASCSEVELDTLTGDFHLLRSDLCMDVGQSLNPAIDIGQVCPSLARHSLKPVAISIHTTVSSMRCGQDCGDYPVQLPCSNLMPPHLLGVFLDCHNNPDHAWKGFATYLGMCSM